VGADTSPNDVRITRHTIGSVLECRSSVVGPTHLEDSRRSLDTLDAEPFAESLTGLEILDELTHRKKKGRL